MKNPNRTPHNTRRLWNILSSTEKRYQQNPESANKKDGFLFGDEEIEIKPRNRRRIPNFIFCFISSFLQNVVVSEGFLRWFVTENFSWLKLDAREEELSINKNVVLKNSNFNSLRPKG